MSKCQYGQCQNEATTKGFIFIHEDGKHVPIDVTACDKHKTVESFFEEK